MRIVDQCAHAPRPSRHHHDAIAEMNGLVDVMSDEDHGHAPCTFHEHAVQLRLHALPIDRVERTERLVHEKKCWRHGKRARKSAALLLSARERVRILRRLPIEANERDALSCPCLSLAAGHLREASANAPRHVAEHRAPG